jgi:hypothetical protein
MTISTDGSFQITFGKLSVMDTIEGLGIVIKVAALAQLILGDIIFPAVRDVPLGMGEPGDVGMAVSA